jgi:hypothetical protein
VNNLPASPVLPGMRIHRQYGPSGFPAGRQNQTPDTPDTPDTPARRLGWRLRRRSGRGNAKPASRTDPASGFPAMPSAPGQSAAAAMQMAVGLLTASLDSPELEAWAVDELAPQDADGLDDLVAGLHVISYPC